MDDTILYILQYDEVPMQTTRCLDSLDVFDECCSNFQVLWENTCTILKRVHIPIFLAMSAQYIKTTNPFTG